ncbi:MAG: CBS domain-containing protein [Chloroflexi bacterium]|nr:CBS domain-containing protein [Chloroflexota bacterium]
MGFSRVYDYEAGKADWFAAGLPREGRLAGMPRVGDIVRGDEVTCELNDKLGEAADKARDAGKDQCIVVIDGNVVLGRVRGRALDGDSNQSVEDAMESGPTTFRTNETLEAVVGRMAARNVESVLVTTSDGRLVGTLYRSDAQRRLAEDADRSEPDEQSCNCM